MIIIPRKALRFCRDSLRVRLLFAVLLERSLWTFQPKHPSTAESIALIINLAFHPLCLLSLSMVGTILPALVDRDGSYRVALGIKAAFATMWRLCRSPALAGSVLRVALVGLDFALRRLHLLDLAGVKVGLNVLARSIGFVITILAVSVPLRHVSAHQADTGLTGTTSHRPARPKAAAGSARPSGTKRR